MGLEGRNLTSGVLAIGWRILCFQGELVILGVGLEFWDMISPYYTFGFSFLTEKIFSIIFYFVGWNKGTNHRGFVLGYAWKLSENYFLLFFCLEEGGVSSQYFSSLGLICFLFCILFG